VLRDASPVPDPQRARSGSVKRKEPEGPTFAAVTSGINAANNANNVQNYEEMSDLSLEVAKALSLVEKAAKDINDCDVDPAIVRAFSAICDAMRGIVKVQDRIVTANLKSITVPVPVPPPSRGPEPVLTSLGAISKRQRGPISLSQPAQCPSTEGNSANDDNEFLLVPPRRHNGGSVSGSEASVRPAVSRNEDPAIRRFRDSIRDAERSSLLLKLDMGRIPVVNKETMSKRATLALTTMAAKKEKRNGTIPTAESISAIDDVLSVVKNISFFGTGTKTYTNSKDAQSGAYCTAPVKYEFKDRDTKFAAEKILRATCDVSCTTPYPTIVRECIKQIVDSVKVEYPDNFIRVTIDTEKMVFKVARKPPKGAADPSWKYGKVDIPIPKAALDISARRVPKDFRFEIPDITPPGSPTRNNSRKSSVNSTGTTASPMRLECQEDE
jgi:hypothetical protein